MTNTIGLLLAAGAGRRMGRPKALVTDADGLPWVIGAARTLLAGGCAEVVVVVGAAATEVNELLAAEPVTTVVADDWETGMGASLRAGLQALDTGHADAALVHLVDLPDVGPEIVGRMLVATAPDMLARASYGPQRRHGHPVLIGRDHWGAIAEECAGDSGARAYLTRHGVVEIDCSDLASGLDIDDASRLAARLASRPTPGAGR